MKFGTGIHLCSSDVALDSCRHPSKVQVHIKQSKQIPFSMAPTFSLAVHGRYLSCSLYRQVFSAERTISRSFISLVQRPRISMVAKIRSTLLKVGINPNAYSGNSFRIEAASTAATMRIMIGKLIRSACSVLILWVGAPTTNPSMTD